MSSREIVTVVDGENNEVGTASRGEMRAKGLPHRASYILVFNTRGEIFIQRRTRTKDIYPGYYDVAAGGVVLAGETYEESAKRELFEELGIEPGALTRHFDHYHVDADNKVWGRVFSCVHDGPMILQEEEVESGAFVPLESVFEMATNEPFTPDGVEILRRYLKPETD
jgi:8-oxo-dGTP pyrophosphatase MutT (NUDIX family)